MHFELYFCWFRSSNLPDDFLDKFWKSGHSAWFFGIKLYKKIPHCVLESEETEDKKDDLPPPPPPKRSNQTTQKLKKLSRIIKYTIPSKMPSPLSSKKSSTGKGTVYRFGK